MFDAVRNNKRIVQIFLGLITLPFAFWGLESLQGFGTGNDLASVGKTRISQPQFEQAMRERQEQLRQSMGNSFRPEMMDSPQFKLSVLDSLIHQRLLLLEAAEKRLATGTQDLRDFITGLPVLQENGVFSKPRYEAVLRAQGMSPEQFEADVRQDMTLRQLVDAVSASAIVSSTQAEALLRIQIEERKFSEFKIASAPFAEKLKIEPDVLQKFYDENKSLFEVPEQVRAEYVVLSLDAIMSQLTVSAEEIEKWYEANRGQYGQPEERRASHILIAPDDAGKEKAKARAEEILREVRKNPSRFAELAKQHSKDPGSSKNGGDLGFFAPGTMVKPFEDTVFNQKEGEISDPVETDFGYHIIKLTGIRPAKERSLEEVRGEIENKLKRQAADRQFSEAAETFNNLVYEQSDSLQPVADRFKLKIEASGWLPKNAGAPIRETLGMLDNDKVLTALFSEDAIKNKRNTEAVEIAPNTLLAARVAEHTAALIRPFDAVKDEIEKILKDEEALKQAQSAAQTRLAALEKGEDTIDWAQERTITRQQARQSQLPPAALRAIFKADVRKLPAYVIADTGEAYTLFKITQVVSPEKIDDEQLKSLKEEYANIVAQEDLSTYLSSLRSRYRIDVNASLLENRER
jgi:peptidyl-prolyl cis-trans isomerase D